MSTIFSGAVGAIVSYFILAWLFRQSGKAPRFSADGFVILNLNPGLIVMGFLALSFGLCFAALTIIGLLAGVLERGWILVIFAPLAPYFLFAAYTTLAVRIRFGQSGIAYSGFGKPKLVPWEDVSQVIDSNMLGTFLRTSAGRLWITKYRRGFPLLLKELKKRNVPGADDLGLSGV